MQMKTNARFIALLVANPWIFLATFSLASCALSSCSSDYADLILPKDNIAVDTVKNLFANVFKDVNGKDSGEYIKYSFTKKDITTTDDWDIAFRGTSIIINGGEKVSVSIGEPQRTGNAGIYIESMDFEKVTIAYNERMKKDAQNNPVLPNANSWFEMANNIVTPKANTTLVIRTKGGNFAKLHIQSFYKDAPSSITSSSPPNYYTFYFFYQTSGSISLTND